MERIRDGDLYKIVEIDGVVFRICYGYISEVERERGWEPYPVYPDFTLEPRYSEKGEAFATAFQDVCEHYEPSGSGERWCNSCRFFDRREQCIGLCLCPSRRENRS